MAENKLSTPVDAPAQYSSPMRHLIEEAIESLLLVLDELDGDAGFEAEPDLEDSLDTEHELGTTNAIDQSKALLSSERTETLEYEGDTCPECDRKPDHDDEAPWLV